MQPYLFPYLGYFQLIHAVETFIVYDDVNYIKGGWINRNFMLSQGRRSRFTLQVRGASTNVAINEVAVGDNRSKLLKSFRQNYSRAPHFRSVFPLVEKILLHEEDNLARYLDHGLRTICHHLGLSPQWIVSSDVDVDEQLRGQERVVALCRALEANCYVNLPGGRQLYDRKRFRDEGLDLAFLEPRSVSYPQFGDDFVPQLSIVDVMMFNSPEQCSRLLTEYSLDS